MTEQANTTSRKPLVGIMTGIVVSDKRDKTSTVEVSYRIKHAKYGKYLRRTTRYHVHDPENQAKEGNTVEIARCRPISKTKNWRLVRVVN